MSTVVTGGAGFIGCHLVKRLLDEGRNVLVVDNFSRGSLENLKDVRAEKVKWVKADLRDYSQALAAIKDAETVYHLAAVVGSVEYLHGSEMAELRALQDNLVIDANVFRACLQRKVRKIVYASSVSVYPIDLQQRLDVLLSEEDLRYYNPEGGYGWCISGSTRIITYDGLKQIQYIKPLEDFVLGKDGKWHRVLAVHRRKLLPSERFILFKPSRGPAFWVTPSHQILTSEGWKRIEQVIPYKTGRRENTEILEPTPYILEEKPPSKLDFRYKGYRSAITCTKDFWRLIGFWLAEGTLEKYTGLFAEPGYISLSQKDRQVLEKYLNIVKELDIDPDAKINGPQKNGMYILRFWHEGLWRWLHSNFIAKREARKTAREKTIPLWLAALPDPDFSSFFEGWYEGDGKHESDPKRRSPCISTSSAHLAGRMYVVMRARGINCSLSIRKTYAKDNYVLAWLGSNYQNNGHFINKVYGNYTKEAYAYDLEVEGENSYTLPGCVIHNSKLLGEIELSWMKNIDIGIARIFTAYGPGEPLDETAHAVPALIRKAISYPKEDFIVWGTGEQTRSFMYVSDCVEALLRLEEKASNPPLIVNVGSDEPISIRELAEKIVDISGKEIEIKYDPSKPVGPMSRTADIRKAREALGWNPMVSLEEGLRHTYGWVKKKLQTDSI